MATRASFKISLRKKMPLILTTVSPDCTLTCLEVMIMKLKEYEKTALKFYTNNDINKRVITAKGFEPDSVANKMAEELGNPYRLMF